MLRLMQEETSIMFSKVLFQVTPFGETVLCLFAKPVWLTVFLEEFMTRCLNLDSLPGLASLGMARGKGKKSSFALPNNVAI